MDRSNSNRSGTGVGGNQEAVLDGGILDLLFLGKSLCVCVSVLREGEAPGGVNMSLVSATLFHVMTSAPCTVCMYRTVRLHH